MTTSTLFVSRLPDVVNKLDAGQVWPQVGTDVSLVWQRALRVQAPPKPRTRLRVEEILVLCWSAVNEARSASVDWLALVNSLDALRLSEVLTLHEISQSEVSRVEQLDAQETVLLDKLRVVIAGIEFEEQRKSELAALNTLLFKDKSKQDAAVRTTALPTFKRDPIPGQPAPYAMTSDPALTEFGAGLVFEQAVNAQVWSAQQLREFSGAQFAMQERMSEKAVSVAKLDQQALEGELKVLDAQRMEQIARTEALRLQLEATQAKLSSLTMDWQARAAGLFARYAQGMGRLEAFGPALVECLKNVYPEQFNPDWLQRLTTLVSAKRSDMGARLEEVMAMLHEVETGMASSQLRSVRRQLHVAVGLTLEGPTGSSAFELTASEVPGGVARLRGLSIRRLEPDVIQGAALAVLIKPPTESKRPGSKDIDQAEIGQVDLGLVWQPASTTGEDVRVSQQLWNASPVGTWTLEAHRVGNGESGSSAVSLLITMHLDCGWMDSTV